MSMIIKQQYSKKQVLIIFVLLFLTSSLYGFIFTMNFFTRSFFLCMALVALVIYFKSRKNKEFLQSVFYKEFCFLYLWSLVPALTTMFFGGSFLDEFLNGLAFSFTAVVYPAFYKYRVTEKTIIIAFALFSIIATIIQIMIQLHPELAFFGAQSEEDIVWGMRNGLYRVRPGCIQMTVFLGLFYWCEISKKIDIYSLVMFAFMFTGMYLELTRQIYLGFAVAILYTVFWGRNSKVNYKILFLVCVLAVIAIYKYWDVLFASMVSSYKEDTFTTDIRQKCMSFTFSQLLDNPILSFFGHGHLEVERLVWWVKYHYFMSDIGFVGEAFYKGFFWIYVYFKMIYMLLLKYRKQVPLYVKAFVVATGVISMSIFPYSYPISLFVWSSMLYISSLYIKRKEYAYKK